MTAASPSAIAVSRSPSGANAGWSALTEAWRQPVLDWVEGGVGVLTVTPGTTGTGGSKGLAADIGKAPHAALAGAAAGQ